MARDKYEGALLPWAEIKQLLEADLATYLSLTCNETEPLKVYRAQGAVKLIKKYLDLPEWLVQAKRAREEQSE